MSLSGSKLIARVIREDEATFRTEVVASGAPQRLPAVALHSSRDDAEQWVKTEAAALGVDVEWNLPVGQGHDI